MASVSWKSGTTGTWTTSNDWTPVTTPGSGDDVTIAATGTYTVTTTVAAAAHSVTLDAATATLSDTSTLTLGTVMLLTAGTFRLNGTVAGGTIEVAGGTLQIGGGTLDGVTCQGTISLGTSGVVLTVVDGLSLTQAGGSGAGSVNLNGSAAILSLVGTQTFDHATVSFGNAGQSSETRLIEKDIPGTGATLTLGGSLTVQSNGGYGYIQSLDTAANDALVNAGTITLASSGGLIEVSANKFTNTGHMVVGDSGTLDLLVGPYLVAAGEVGSNTGSISISSGLLAFGSNFSNSGSVVATGGTVTIAGTFATTGTFQANNTKLSIGGTISGGALLALLNNSSDTVTYTATYDNTGAVLNIGSGSTIGTLSLTSQLPIRNGTIADAGGGFVFSGGTLTNVAYQGTIDLSRNGANLNIATHLAAAKAGGGGPGTVKLSGTSSLFSFIGSQTFDAATVSIGSTVRTAMSILQEHDIAGTGATLTLGPSLQVVSNGGNGLLLSTDAGQNDALVNQGTIQAAASGGLIEISTNSFTNQGSLLVSGSATLDVLSGPFKPVAGELGSSSGVITETGGLLAFGGTFTNTGSFTVSGGTLTLAGTFSNTGALQVNNATVNLGGVFSGVSLLALVNNSSDDVTAAGTYNNTGGTLSLGAGTTVGTLTLEQGLTVRGGTIVDLGGGLVCADGTLDGVTYDGTLTLASGAQINVLDGLVLQSGTGGGAGVVNLTTGFASLDFLNTQTIDNAVLTLGDASGSTDSLYDNAVAGTLTLGDDLVVQQTIGISQIYTYGSATTVNLGLISVAGTGTFELLGNGGSFVNAGTISVGGTASLGAYDFAGSSHFSNSGLLSIGGSASVTLEAGWSNTGTISVNGANLQLGSDTTTAWGAIGTIIATNATLELEGALTTAQLDQLSLSGDLTQILGVLDNSGTLLSVGAGTALGTITLDGGTITGGTIADSGGGLVFGLGTLDGVTYRGTLAVASGGQAWIEAGLTVLTSGGGSGGTINLTGGGAGLLVMDTEALDNATILIGDASFNTDYIENNIYPGAGTLTLGAHLVIREAVGDASVLTASADTTVNDGQIVVTGGTFHVDYGTFTNAATITLSGSASQFNDNIASFTNTGTITATSGAGIALQAGWSNTGTISMTGGGDLQLGSDTTTAWGSIGTIVATASTLDLYGAFTTAQLMSLTLSSDSANIDGVLNNAGSTLSIGAGSVLAALGPTAGGVIQGGIVSDAGGGIEALGGTLDDIAFRGLLAIGAAGTLNIIGGLVVHTLAAGAGTITLTGGGSTLAVLDSETLDNVTVLIGDASGTTDVLSNAGGNGNTLTLGAGLLLQQTTGSAQILANGSSDVTVNNGQISVTSGTLDISGGNFTNAGTISATGGGVVTFEQGVLANYASNVLTGGVYVVGAGSTLELAEYNFISTLAADVTLNGTSAAMQAVNGSGGQIDIDNTIRTITAGGALRLLSGHSTSIYGTLQDQGLLQLGGGTAYASSGITIGGTLLGFGQVNGNVADNGLIEANGGVLTLANTLTGSGLLQIDGSGTLELSTTDTLDANFSGAGGTLLLDRPTTYSGTIGGFAIGDSLVLDGVTASTASIVGGTLEVNLTNGNTLDYAVTGSFTGLSVSATNAGGDAVIALASAAPTQITGLLDNRGHTLHVGSGTTDMLAGGEVLGGTIVDTGGGFLIGYGTLDAVTYWGTLTIGAGGALDVAGGLTADTVTGGSPGNITLVGGGSTLTVQDSETLDDATMTIGDSSGTTDILANGGGNGNTLTLGDGFLLQQTTGSAQILSNGSSDVTVNNGRIAVSGGTLDISGGTFSNVGTITVSGGEVMFEPGTLTNFANGVLTGGVYLVDAGATLELPKSSFIATLNADVTLSGAGSLMQSVNSSGSQVGLDGTLHTIDVGGALRLLSGRSLALKGSFADQGLLQLGGGTLSNTSTTTVSGTLSGYGTVSGGLSDGGVVEANGGRLSIVNIASGTGRLQVDAGATLEIVTTDALASSFSGAAGTLLLDKPSTYTGTIGGFAVGETIVLGGVTATAASITSGTLSVTLTTGKTLTYAVTGSFSGLTVQTTSVGGNTDVTLSSGGGMFAEQAASRATPISTAALSLGKAAFLHEAGQATPDATRATSTNVAIVAGAAIAAAHTGSIVAASWAVEPSLASSSLLGASAAAHLAAIHHDHATTLTAHH